MTLTMALFCSGLEHDIVSMKQNELVNFIIHTCGFTYRDMSKCLLWKMSRFRSEFHRIDKKSRFGVDLFK